MEEKLSGFSQDGLLGRGANGYLEIMSRKGVCVGVHACTCRCVRMCVWCCCMKKSTASIYFSLRISLVSVSIVSSFMYTSTAYMLSSYHKPGPVLGL